MSRETVVESRERLRVALIEKVREAVGKARFYDRPQQAAENEVRHLVTDVGSEYRLHFDWTDTRALVREYWDNPIPYAKPKPTSDYYLRFEHEALFSESSRGGGPVNLERAVERERATQEARAIVAEERQLKRFRQPEQLRSLKEELELPILEEEWRIADLLPAGGNLLIAAGFKTGKTTLMQNLVRSLVDHEPFLDEYLITPPAGRVALFNFELTRAQQIRWLRDSGIGNTGQVMLAHLRGMSGILTTATGRDWVTEQLRRSEVEVWIVDPLARAASGVDENSNTEVGLFLEQLDEIKANAGVKELVLVTHTGRTTADAPTRARGATRVNDWADVNMTMTKDAKEVRSFSAEGRDVWVGKTPLTFDPATRRLAIVGEEEQLLATASGLVAEVVAVAAAGGPEGVSGNQLETTVKGRAIAIREARSQAIAQGLLREDTSGRWPRFVATQGQQVAF